MHFEIGVLWHFQFGIFTLTDGNCPVDKHKKNKEYASQKEAHKFNLFTGWYNSLEELEVQDFIDSLI